MKSIITITLSLAICILSKAQYVHFTDTAKTWVIMSAVDNTQDILPPDYTYCHVYFSGDSVWGGKEYSKLMGVTFRRIYVDETSGNTLIDDTIRSPWLYCLIREDTVEQKLYIVRNSSAPVEDLLFDFSLMPGDTLKSEYYYAINGKYPVVDSIQQILLANGEPRRKFCINASPVQGFIIDWYFIEGVGGDNGLIEPFSIFYFEFVAMYETIVCLRNDEEVLFGPCNMNLDISETSGSSMADVFPNPFENELFCNFHAANGNHVLVELFDITGNCVFKNLCTNQENLTINVDGLDKGLYLIRISCNNSHYSRRILKM